jgi:hypothetical protein
MSPVRQPFTLQRRPGFRSLLKYENGQFYANPTAKQPKPAGLYRTASLILVNGAGNEIKRFSAEIPIGGAEAAVGRPEAWALTIPSRDLYKLDLQADTTRVEWTAAMGDPACITFVYPEKKGYSGAVGAEVKLP